MLANSEDYKDVATSYGFDFENDVYGDEAKRSRCSAYAYAMGTWRYHPIDNDERHTVYWWYHVVTRIIWQAQ